MLKGLETKTYEERYMYVLPIEDTTKRKYGSNFQIYEPLSYKQT